MTNTTKRSRMRDIGSPKRNETLTGALRDLYFARIAAGDSDFGALSVAKRAVVSAAEGWHLEPSCGPRPELLPSHPGHALLTEAHALRFESALSALKARGDTDHVGRAEWLVFWTRWALKNCKVPVLVNT